jgi:hypothetical protein
MIRRVLCPILVTVVGLTMAASPATAQNIPQRLAALEAAVAALQTQVNSNAATIAALQAALVTEQGARATADASLQTQIAAVAAAQPGTVYWSFHENADITSSNVLSPTTVATLDLPAGKYLVTARLNVNVLSSDNSTQPNVTCVLGAFGINHDVAQVTANVVGFAPPLPFVGVYFNPVTMQAPFHSGGSQTVNITCSSTSPEGTVASGVRLIAVPINSVEQVNPVP